MKSVGWHSRDMVRCKLIIWWCIPTHCRYLLQSTAQQLLIIYVLFHVFLLGVKLAHCLFYRRVVNPGTVTKGGRL